MAVIPLTKKPVISTSLQEVLRLRSGWTV